MKYKSDVVGSEYIWLRVDIIDPETKDITGMSISKERNMFVMKRFLYDIVEVYGQHPYQLMGNMVPTNLKIPEVRSSYSFVIWKEYHRKDYSLFERYNRMFWQLLAM